MTSNQGSKPLDSSRLLEQAVEKTGLSEWGQDKTFEIGLSKLCESIEVMDCGPVLREDFEAQAIALLSTRLHLVNDEIQNPEILKGKIERPIVVCGLPRTGTTWLYELLALDPVARAPLDWEVQSPWPAPEAATYDTDRRIAQAQAGYDALLAAAPELATMHHFDSKLPQECNAITPLHFASSNFWSAYGVPDYTKWITFGKPKGVMNTHRRVLQQLQWKGPKGRWTLKSPPYLLMLEDLLEAYPDACLIQTHREPAKMVASLSSFIRALRRVRYSHLDELMDPKEIARSVLMHFGEALECGTRSRKNSTIDRSFVDIAYRDLVSKPIEAVQSIYEKFNLPFTSEYENILVKFVSADRSTGHGKHIYDPKQFGIEELDLPNQFGEYRARFGDMLSDS